MIILHMKKPRLKNSRSLSKITCHLAPEFILLTTILLLLSEHSRFYYGKLETIDKQKENVERITQVSASIPLDNFHCQFTVDSYRFTYVQL